jgi:hypothetical protein
MLRKVVEFLSAAIPFTDPYPPWVKVSVIVLIAVVILLLVFFRIPQSERQTHSRETLKTTEGTTGSQTASLINSPNVKLYQAGRDA